jgi:Asp-tRNA(Asn)/Glu-tRNA(Gln) amidotransferase A subunit family amidase
MIAAAEKIVGLSFTDAERDLMLDNLNNSLQSYTQLRALSIPNHVPPAVQFSPLLPGRTLPVAGKAPKKVKSPEVVRPGSDAELAFLPVTALADLVRRRQVTATELTQLYLARLRRHDPALRCVVTLTEERALRQAAAADAEIGAGKYRGPLHGIPWGAKDLLSVPGYPTTWGSPLFRNQMLETTATVVERLDAAGAILVAKLTLGEFAQGDVWFGGTTKNPWKTDQGSSGSSAGPGSATAAGLVGFSIGTETLGSIVSPSTRNGVSGLRPTFGRVSRSGAMALSWSMDKIGPMCRSVADCALVFDAIHGPDGRDSTVHAAPFAWDPARPLSSIRVGYLKAAFEQERPLKALDDAALAAFRGLGLDPVAVEMPTGIPTGALRIILSAEAAAAFDEITRDDRDDQMVQQTASAWPNSFRAARFIPAVEYINANRARSLLMERMERVFDAVDVFITPSFGANVLLTTNLTGHPAVTVPSGFREDGTPVSISFIGKLFGEADLCRVASAWQEATRFHLRHPAAFMA